MTHDPPTPRQAAPDAPPSGDSLRLVRLRLYLTIAAAAILPLALGSPLVRILADEPNGLEPVTLAALAAVCPARRPHRWMIHQIQADRGFRRPRASTGRTRKASRPRRRADRAREPPRQEEFSRTSTRRIATATSYPGALDLDEFKQVNDARVTPWATSF
jgi:hypothetical protein